MNIAELCGDMDELAFGVLVHTSSEGWITLFFSCRLYALDESGPFRRTLSEEAPEEMGIIVVGDELTFDEVCELIWDYLVPLGPLPPAFSAPCPNVDHFHDPFGPPTKHAWLYIMIDTFDRRFLFG